MWMNAANLISLLRLLLAPVVIWLLLENRAELAFYLFLFAGITDAADGMIAKRFGQVTELGAYLDPLADKTLLVGIFITLGVMGQLPAWLVLLMVSRDAIIIGGVLLSYTLDYRFVMRPLLISKANTVAQIILAALVLWRMGMTQMQVTLLLAPAIDYVVWFVAVTTGVSGGAYIYAWVTGPQSGAGDGGPA